MEYLFLVGRLLYGGFFLKSGIRHLRSLQPMSGYAASKGVPFPKLAVAGSGLLIILGGLGVLLGIYIPWAVACLVAFLVPVTFMMHSFWKDTDPMAKMSNRVNFEKNLALLGAALLLLSIAQPWMYSAF